MQFPPTGTFHSYRITSRPQLSRINPAYLWCSVAPEIDPLDPEADELERRAAEHGSSFRILVPRILGRSVQVGSTFSDDHLKAVDGLSFPVLDQAPATPVQVVEHAEAEPAVSQPVSAHPRVPVDRDNGWGDDDHIAAQEQQPRRQAVATAPRPQPAHGPVPSIAGTVRERERAVLAAGNHIPIELLRSLRITAHAYNMVSTLITATGRPGPQDVRALVITNVIAWAKTDSGDQPNEAMVTEAADAFERILKQQT